MSDPATTLERLVAKAGGLYSLPAVAMEVLELTSNPKVDARALKQCIENDPALTTKLLRVVNSSLFGLAREVSDLNQALALLGIKPLKLLVLGFSLPAGLFAGVASEVLGKYWRHTLIKAVAAREIGEAVWSRPGDEAFIAGLLQDLGILVLLQELGEPYVRFLHKVLDRGGNLAALETESIGFDHTMLTARLLARWGLPDVLVQAVSYGARRGEQELPTSSPPALPQVLHLAELFARFLADARADVLADLIAVGELEHGLSRKQLEQLLDSLEEKVQQLADVLSLQLPEGLDHQKLLARAHRQLAEVAASAAEDLVRAEHPPASSARESAAYGEEFQTLSEAVARAARRTAEPANANPEGRPSADPAPASDAVKTASATDTAVQTDPGFMGQLAAAVTACRRSRCSLSLLLVELADMDDLIFTFGLEGFDTLRRSLEDACRNVDHPYTVCCPHTEAGFAVILPTCDRQLAVRLGNQLIERARQLTVGKSSRAGASVNVGVGIAALSLPPKNFPPEELFAAADRCLYGSHASGGGVVKSIEIC